MPFPVMSRTREYRVDIPALNGGLDLSVPPYRIADNQLAEAVNVWYKDGALQTRPTLGGVKLMGYENGTEFSYGNVGDYGYVTGVCTEAKKRYVTFVLDDGSVRPHPIGCNGDGIQLMVASSKNPSEDGEDVLVYVAGNNAADCGVYGLRKTTSNWEKLSPYVPTVMINGRPQTSYTGATEGHSAEAYNLLSEEYKCSYTPDKSGLYYYLPRIGDELLEVELFLPNSLDKAEQHTLIYDKNLEIYVDSNTGGFASGVKVAYSKDSGCFWFYETLPEGVPDREEYPKNPIALQNELENCIRVKMKRSDSEFIAERNRILKMRFSTWFGGAEGLAAGTRLFVSGNDEYKNLVHWSALNNPLYFPENNYVYVGEDNDAVTAFGKQSDMLVVFKEREIYYTTHSSGATVTADDIISQTVVDTEAAAAVFPLHLISANVGCTCPQTVRLCNNRLVWLNGDGRVYGLFSAGAYSERNVRTLSLSVESLLHKFQKQYFKTATAACYKDYYLLVIGGRVLVMDFSSYGFQYYGSYSNDEQAERHIQWYVWDTAVRLKAVVSVLNGAVLVAGDDNEAYLHTMILRDSASYDDIPKGKEPYTQGAVVSRVRTKQFDFGYPEKLKRVNALHLELYGEAGASVYIGYHSEKADFENKERLGTKNGNATLFTVMPNVLRVRRFGISIIGEAPMKIVGLTLKYAVMGRCGR